MCDPFTCGEDGVPIAVAVAEAVLVEEDREGELDALVQLCTGADCGRPS